MRAAVGSRLYWPKTRSPLVQTTSDLAKQIWTPYGSNPFNTKANGVNEYDIVYQGGTYYLFWSNDTDYLVRCDSATTLSGPWTAVNGGASLFAGRYPTVIYDSSLSLWRAWSNDVVSHSGDLHYLTAATPGGTWTDQGVAISPPGSGPYSNPCPLDPCVRILADGTYIMGATDITYNAGEVGFWTSPSGNNGTWTLQRYPLVDYTLPWETVRYDPAPFISSAGELVLTYGTGYSLSNTLAAGMAIYDHDAGGWSLVSRPLVTGPIGNPTIFEFTPGQYTLVYSYYPSYPSVSGGGLGYSTASAGAPGKVPHVWDYASLP